MTSPGCSNALPQRAAALVEQLALSGANFIAFLVLARQLAPADWGAFGFAYALLLFMQGFQRASVTIPMIPYSAHGAGWSATRQAWAGMNLGLSLLCAAGLALVAAVLQLVSGGWLVQAFAMASLLAVPMFLHEFARRAAIQEGRTDLLAAMGLAYAVVLTVAVLWPGAAGRGAWSASIAWAAAAAVAAAVYAMKGGTPLRLRRAAWPDGAGYRHYVGWAALGHLGHSGYNFGVQAILAALAGPAAVGAFHACRTLVQPVSVLLNAMDGVDKPRAAAALARGGPAAMRRVLWHSLATMAILALPVLTVAALWATPLLTLAYGERYATQGTLVAAWCVASVCMLLAQPVESGLYMSDRTRALFVGRAAAAAAGTGVALWLVPVHGATGAVAALAAGFFVAAVSGALQLRHKGS
ncbi:MAG: oligosaccharide flippase family protein [Rubrivivax sp.]|nr:oligosaccharide flippase family protein [Rubrivivax sp.]